MVVMALLLDTKSEKFPKDWKKSMARASEEHGLGFCFVLF
jgi:hypothetical protein